MADEKYRDLFDEFREKNKDCFVSNEEKWVDNMNKCQEYITENNKRPSQSSKDPEIKKLGSWINT